MKDNSPDDEVSRRIWPYRNVRQPTRELWERHFGNVRYSRIHQIIAVAIGYLYLSAIGYIHDVVYFRHGFNVDPLKYVMVEDFAYSAAKHWQLTLISIFVIPVTWFVLIVMWKLFVEFSVVIYKTVPKDPAAPVFPELAYTTPKQSRPNLDVQFNRFTPLRRFVAQSVELFVQNILFITWVICTLVWDVVKFLYFLILRLPHYCLAMGTHCLFLGLVKMYRSIVRLPSRLLEIARTFFVAAAVLGIRDRLTH